MWRIGDESVANQILAVALRTVVVTVVNPCGRTESFAHDSEGFAKVSVNSSILFGRMQANLKSNVFQRFKQSVKRFVSFDGGM